MLSLESGSWPRGGESQLGSALGIGQWESCSAYSLVLISIVVVTVHILRCFVKLPLSRPTSFAFFFPFSSPSHQAEGQYRGHMVLCCRPGLNHDRLETRFTLHVDLQLGTTESRTAGKEPCDKANLKKSSFLE